MHAARSRTIHEALECGINWIDTAAVYGLAHFEEVVAKSFSGTPAERRPYVDRCDRLFADAIELANGAALLDYCLRIQ